MIVKILKIKITKTAKRNKLLILFRSLVAVQLSDADMVKVKKLGSRRFNITRLAYTMSL